jgi:hypothetical protein
VSQRLSPYSRANALLNRDRFFRRCQESGGKRLIFSLEYLDIPTKGCATSHQGRCDREAGRPVRQTGGVSKREAGKIAVQAEPDRAAEAIPLRDRCAVLRQAHPLPPATVKAFFGNLSALPSVTPDSHWVAVAAVTILLLGRSLVDHPPPSARTSCTLACNIRVCRPRAVCCACSAAVCATTTSR